jgi:cytochrome bd-type quinol oxidase subunit 1
MIKVLRLKKGVYVIILGIIALIAYRIVSGDNPEHGMYLLQIAGVCFLAGALMFLYPILFAKKDAKGIVQLDPEKRAAEEEAEVERGNAEAKQV